MMNDKLDILMKELFDGEGRREGFDFQHCLVMEDVSDPVEYLKRNEEWREKVGRKLDGYDLIEANWIKKIMNMGLVKIECIESANEYQDEIGEFVVLNVHLDDGSEHLIGLIGWYSSYEGYNYSGWFYAESYEVTVTKWRKVK